MDNKKETPGTEVKPAETMAVSVDKAGSEPANILSIMAQMGPGFDADQIGKMLEYQERWEKREAEKAYHQAMAGFRANPPKIDKDRLVDYKHKSGQGRTTFRHASLNNVVSKISAALSPHGLAHTWRQAQGDGGLITVTCRLSHAMGHYDETSLSASPDPSGGKNNIQAVGSTVTYLERYTLLAITGLATSDQSDADDPPAEDYETISTDQAFEIEDAITDLKLNRARFCEFFAVRDVPELPATKYQEALDMFAQRRESILQKEQQK